MLLDILKRKLIVFGFLGLIFSNLNAFELRSWNLNDLSLENSKNRDMAYINKQINDPSYDIMCLQGIKDKDIFENFNDNIKLSNKKNIYYSDNILTHLVLQDDINNKLKTNEENYVPEDNSNQDNLKSITLNNNDKEYYAWVIKKGYGDVDIIKYEDKNNVFKVAPQMLWLKNVNLGIVNFTSKANSKEDKFKEIKEIADMLLEFSEISKIDNDRIFMCGSFGLSLGEISRNMGHLSSYFKVLNNFGTTIHEKLGYSNDDLEHFISTRNGNAEAMYNYLMNYESYKDFIEKVSPNIPIRVKF